MRKNLIPLFFCLVICCNKQNGPIPFMSFMEEETLAGETKGEESGVISFERFYKDSTWLYNENIEERVEALNIPQNQFEQISTTDLVSLCLEYPFFADCFAASSPSIGVRQMIQMFNGFSELKKREEANREMIRYYQAMDVESIAEGARQNDEESVRSILHLCYVEEVLSALLEESIPSKTLIEVRRAAEENNSIKRRYPDVFGALSFESSSHLFERIDELASCAELSTNSVPVNNRDFVILYTTYGRTVMASVRPEELSDAEKLSNQLWLSFNHPLATYLGPATTTYNCHNYAWNMSEGGGTYWISATASTFIPDGTYDTPHENLQNFWLDGKYTLTTSNLATKIYYYRGDHSAIKSSVPGKYESKWGPGCLVRHSPTDCPAEYFPSYRLFFRPCIFSLHLTGDCGILDVGVSYYFDAPEMALGVSSSFEWRVTDDKYGEDVVGTWATVQNATGTSADITITKAGNYHIELHRYHPNRGELVYTIEEFVE